MVGSDGVGLPIGDCLWRRVELFDMNMGGKKGSVEIGDTWIIGGVDRVRSLVLPLPCCTWV
jgi:hypothetical protein